MRLIMEPERALPCPKERAPAAHSSSVSENSRSGPHTLLVSLKIQFNIIISSLKAYRVVCFPCLLGWISHFLARPTCLAHANLLYLATILWGVQYGLRSCSLWYFTYLFLSTFKLWSSLGVKNQDSQVKSQLVFFNLGSCKVKFSPEW